MALSDFDLVTLAKATRGSAAFDELVRRHQAPLRAFLVRITADTSLADDLAQEALIKAYRKLEGFRGGASFRSWLFSIAIREAQMARRKSTALSNAETSGLDESETGGASEHALDLQRALAALSADERAAALLCDAAGFSHAEAAAAMGAPLGTVKTLVARARENLRAALGIESRASGQQSAAIGESITP